MGPAAGAQVIITSGPTGSGKSLLASTVATRIGAVDILDADGKARVAPPPALSHSGVEA